ncbi:MAG: hypothetical protein ACIAQF_02255 [Phycisphaerales bacterium JB065]
MFFRLLPALALAVLLLGGCSSPSSVAFRVTDEHGDPVVAAHARIILLDAGVPLPVNGRALEEAGMITALGGGFTDAAGLVQLPVSGGREHLIEIEGPVLGAIDPRNAPVATWVYRPADGSLQPQGETAQSLRVERAE